MSPDAHFPAAKLLQKFGINKDLTVKIKFILIFSGKYWVFAQGCERKFGGKIPNNRQNEVAENPPGVYAVKEGKGRAEFTTKNLEVPNKLTKKNLKFAHVKKI